MRCRVTICSFLIFYVYLDIKVTYNDGMEMKRELTRGDIVSIKPEWLDPSEDASMKYVVLEIVEPERVLVQALGTGLPLPPTYVYDVAWLFYSGHVLK